MKLHQHWKLSLPVLICFIALASNFLRLYELTNTEVVMLSKDTNWEGASNGSSGISQNRCAICFFGLPRAFNELVFPSIYQNVLRPNAQSNCDIFVHYYEKFREYPGRDNVGGRVNPHSVLKMEDAVDELHSQLKAGSNRKPSLSFKYDTEEKFWSLYGRVVEKFQTATNPDGTSKYGVYGKQVFDNNTIANIVKQWHSIQSSFHLMEEAAKGKSWSYDRVAMLRLDVMFLTPIRISLLDQGVPDLNNEYFTSPGFSMWPVNDRLAYGPTPAIRIWATSRFELIENRANQPHAAGKVLHPESFLSGSVFPQIEKLGYKLHTNYDICFLRVRPDISLLYSDCNKQGKCRNLTFPEGTRQLVESISGLQCRSSDGPKVYNPKLHCNKASH